MFKKLVNKKGFTLVELLIVMAVVAILVAIIIPSFKGMQEEGWITKAEQELQTLQTAVESYYRHHDNVYPPSLGVLVTANPQIIYKDLKDPWKTDGDSYGYIVSGNCYVIYSQSIDRTANILWNGDQVTKNSADKDSDIAVSNYPISF